MQQPTANGCVRNGATDNNGATQENGHDLVGGDYNQDHVIMDKTNQDIVRLIGQHLKTVGLKYVNFLISYVIIHYKNHF